MGGSPEGTLGGIFYAFPLCFMALFLCISVFYGFIPYVFLLCFMVLLKQLRRLYTGGPIFQVLPVYNYSNYYTEEFPMYFYVLWFYFYVFPLCFIVLLKQITEAIHKQFYFSSTTSV